MSIYTFNLSSLTLSCVALAMGLISPASSIAPEGISLLIPQNALEDKTILINTITGEAIDPDNLPEGFSFGLASVTNTNETYEDVTSEDGISTKRRIITKGICLDRILKVCTLPIKKQLDDLYQQLSDANVKNIPFIINAIIEQLEENKHKPEIDHHKIVIERLKELQPVILEYNKALLDREKGHHIDMIKLCLELMHKLNIGFRKYNSKEDRDRYCNDNPTISNFNWSYDILEKYDEAKSHDLFFDIYDKGPLSSLITKEALLMYTIIYYHTRCPNTLSLYLYNQNFYVPCYVVLSLEERYFKSTIDKCLSKLIRYNIYQKISTREDIFHSEPKST